MLQTSILAAALLLASFATAKTCHNFTVPVSISSRNGVFGNMMTPETALDATTFIQNQTKQGANFTKQALTGYATVSGEYNISAKFCVPSGANGTLKDPTAQVLTHGIGFDKTYWDLSYNNYNYSYIDNAVDQSGYCTLSYDRLGIGESSHGEPRDEIQAFLEIEALAALTRMLRSGTLPTVDHAFSRVVHVGHSFGSAQTYGLVATYPDISDGIVLSGFSLNSSFTGFFAAGGNFQQAQLNQPIRFGTESTAMAIQGFLQTYALTDLIAPFDVTTAMSYSYSPGYLVSSNANALQYQFFYPGYFDTGLLYNVESTKQPVTVGEMLTLGSSPRINKFGGPVFVITGSNDVPFCGGDCLNTGGAMASIPADVQKGVPNAKTFEAYIQPNTGHGINLHYNATGAYNVIQSFLSSNGLQSR